MKQRPRPQGSVRPARIGIVGFGRVGTALGRALSYAGRPVTAVAGGSAASRDRAERWLPHAVRTGIDGLADHVDVVVLTVPDDAIAGVVSDLVDAISRPGLVVAHVSGAHGLGILEPLRATGAQLAAIHPAMTFTGSPDDATRLVGTTFAVTADGSAMDVVDHLIGVVGGRVELVPEAARALYHAALAHGANHLVTVVGDACELLEAVGVEQPAALIGPLLRTALENVLSVGDAALTGPIARGDIATVQAHLDALRAIEAPSTDAYVALARRTAERAGASSIIDLLDRS